MARVIDDAGDGDYTLLVTDEGDLEARKRIPHDGVRYYSTASRALPSGRRTASEFGLSIDEVLDQYAGRSATTTPRPQLAEDAARALQGSKDEAGGGGIDA
ncbi:hypothetical protein [Halorhabdus amylolytica]|uniref:hypothetical protein n=1 Tax=Halorhabdus amylolytica TaxID=2559573 RepID=UPI0010A9C0B9|nr:hypothetical protein [Halorhabdus amylolytica]